MSIPIERSRAHYQGVFDVVAEKLPDSAYLITSYLMPLYFLNESITIPIDGKPASVLNKRAVAAFFGDHTDPFRTQLKAHLQTQKVLYAIKNLTYPITPMPSTTALERHAKDYRDKYTIDLHVASVTDVGRLLAEKRKPYSHMGVIVVDNTSIRSGHVTSLLCYFSGYDEYLIIDSGEENPLATTLRTQLAGGRGRVYETYLGSQADSFSCRTGALAMMRNILLFYKHEKEYWGVKNVMRDFNIPIKNNRMEYLPPVWTVTNQIVHPKTYDFYSVIHRDRESSKKEKREKPKTTKPFRESHQREKITFEITLQLDAATTARLGKLPLPNGVRFTPNHECVMISTMNPNMYLVKKAWKNKERIDP